MSKKKILVQIDADANPSVFDSVVGLDSGVDQLLSHGSVDESSVVGLVHGCIFTRAVEDLKSTALFFGGSNVARTEAIVRAAKDAFFGPMRVSLMSDPNGCNTTAAAAVLSAGKHLQWAGKRVTILAGTGPVGIRIAQILANEASVEAGLEPTLIRICSRSSQRASDVCDRILQTHPNAKLEPASVNKPDDALQAVADAEVIFAAGAAGVELLPDGWQSHGPQVVVDVNAVPPAGVSGVKVGDKGQKRDQSICYGAIGVGGLKMKIHRKCIESLFKSNDRILELHEIHAIAKSLMGS